jgi:hypothetical protein
MIDTFVNHGILWQAFARELLIFAADFMREKIVTRIESQERYPSVSRNKPGFLKNPGLVMRSGWMSPIFKDLLKPKDYAFAE